MPLHQSAGHSRRGGALPWRHYDSQAIVAATTHGSASGIYHETDQEAEKIGFKKTNVIISVLHYLYTAETEQEYVFSPRYHADKVTDMAEYIPISWA